MSCKCGNDNCGGVCNYSIGARLYYYFNNANFIETNIGDIKQDTLDRKQTFVVIGAEVEGTNDGLSVGRLMVPTGALDIPMGKKFNGAVDTNRALKEYINKSGMDGTEVLNKLIKFDDNKILPVPLKVGTTCTINYITKNGEKVEEKTKIAKVRWTVDKEDKKFKCFIITEAFHHDTNTRVVELLEDYGDTFTTSTEFSFYTKANLSSHLIKFSRYGYVMPIELKSEGGSIIIDNASVYVKGENDYKATVIGGWKDGKIVIDKELAKKTVKNPKVYKSIENNNVYIKLFRQSMMPYLASDTHVVTVKK